jgi:antitoxin component of RelBE/YafQ-DinJ toxin-antitoxin module
MALKRIHLTLPPAHLRRLDKLAEKLGLDRSNALRYCIARTADLEGIPAEKRG